MSRNASEVADRLHSAAIHLLRRVRVEDEASGLSPARLSALSVVIFAGPLTLGELAAAEGVRSPTMSGIVSGLERDGLVRRSPDPSDARAVRVQTTAKGTRLMRRARQRRLDALARLLRDATPHELETLGRTAEFIERALRAD